VLSTSPGCPNHGVGLARLEFIVNRMIGVHPKALLDFDACRPDLKEVVRAHMPRATPIRSSSRVDRLAEGISTIAAAFAPKPVIVRLSDFKSNEYANLIGGKQYEPHEENPMLGFRGASRYVSDSFKPCFELECRALRRVRNDMGLTNVEKSWCLSCAASARPDASRNCWRKTACAAARTACA
jgi:pyruvate,water dikinase